MLEKALLSAKPRRLIDEAFLKATLGTLFPSEKIEFNTRKKSKLQLPHSVQYMELDVWFPKLNISFEFQEEHHYKSVWYTSLALDQLQYKDNVKRNQIQEQEITLVPVPCWWDGALQSLESNIKFQRPDLLGSRERYEEDLIPLNPSNGFFDHGVIPEVGQLMAAAFPLTSNQVAQLSHNNQWWIGEKYDGIRFCWSPSCNQFYTRNGAQTEMPSQFTDLMGDVFLDAEIWCGRRNFLEVFQSIQSEIDTVDMSMWRLIGFDNADPLTQSFPFEKRYMTLLSNIQVDHPFVSNAPRVLCTSQSQFSEMLEDLLNDGGEGVILQLPNTGYEHGKTPSLLKIKEVRRDQEALVVDVNENLDLTLQLPGGELFSITRANYSLPQKPRMGDIVTFSYDHKHHLNVPSNPIIHRFRTDLNWKEVVANHLQTENYQKYKHKQEDIAAIVENTFDFDPLVMENWYSLDDSKYKQITYVVQRYYQGNLIDALKDTFPETIIDKQKELQLGEYWNSSWHRKLMLKIAHNKGFDPLIAKNWYEISKDIRKIKGGNAIIDKYATVSTALKTLFPEVDLQKKWQSPIFRKDALVQFAKKSGFDPLVADNWYRVTKKDITQTVFHSLWRYHGTLANAIADLFPEIGFNSARISARVRRQRLKRAWT